MWKAGVWKVVVEDGRPFLSYVLLVFVCYAFFCPREGSFRGSTVSRLLKLVHMVVRFECGVCTKFWCS